MSEAFTQEQQEAIVRRSGPLALAASAGSGKTSVLVERYVRAVIEDGIAPGRILAITFTDRAAGELRERVRMRLMAAGEREAARESVGAFVSTFHGFCARLLRTHAVFAGLAPDFAVLGDAQAVALRESAFARALERWLDDEGALDLAAAFGVLELHAAIDAVYDELRSRGERTATLGVPVARHDPVAAAATLAGAAATLEAELADARGTKTIDRALEALAACAELTAPSGTPAWQGSPSPLLVAGLALQNGASALGTAACERYESARVAYEEACADRLGVAAVVLLDRLLGEYARVYASLKRARGVVDFDDLELEARALLCEHEALRAQWSARFERLMVDELQDTNERQMAILAALERDNLFTVGDEFQSIYGFRHANVSLFRERRAALARTGATAVLSTNFRSRAPLLRLVNAVFAARFGADFVGLVPGRTLDGPGPRTEGDAGPEDECEPIVELLLTDTDGWEPHEERLGAELAPAPLWRRAEARLLARRLDQLIATGEAQAEEIVVLFRAGGAIGVYEAALADLGHATLATAGGGFFARPEIIDLVAYLRALANPLDAMALYSVLASPLGGCSSDVLVGLALRAREREASVWEVLEAEPPDARSAAFAARFARARRAAADRPLAEIVASAVAEFAYDRHLYTLHAPERRIANVHKLERLARDFEAREGRDLRRFAQALALGRVGSLRETEAPPAAGTGAIRLMTIHSAKGLEFPVVCVADLAHQLAERSPPLLVDRGRVGLRLPTLARRAVDTLAYTQLRAERAQAALAEEQRIIYVAMTRARDRLILSGAARFEKWPAEAASAIAWLGPALVNDLEAHAARSRAGGAPSGAQPGVPGGVQAPAGGQVVRGAGDVALRLTLCTAERAPELLGYACPPEGASPPGSQVGEIACSGPVAPPGDADPIPDAPIAMRVSAPKPTALSYSAIAEYERCAYRYHLQRVIGLPDVEGPGAGGTGAARGVVVHALLERLDFAAPVSPSERDVTDAARLAGVELAPGEDRAALAALAGGFARSPLCGRLARAGEVRREEAFAFLLPDAELLRGFLDVAALEPDGTLLIVDYKSDRVACAREGADAGELEARVEREYSMQRLVYAIAGLASGAPAVEVAHCFLRRPEVLLATRYEASERWRLEALLTGRLGPLRAGRFDVSADPNRERCGSCPGRARLCSHEEVMTLREGPQRLIGRALDC